MQIEFYEFGRIKIDGKYYDRDVAIFPDKIFSPWTRKTSHYLSLEDLEQFPDLSAEAVIIGTGYSGFVRIDPAVEEFFKNKNIELIVEKTMDACNTFNNLSQKKKTIAIFHLTC